MDIYKIDVTGKDILSENFGIIILYNNKHAYAYKFSSAIQSEITENYRNGSFGYNINRQVKPRLYTSVVYLILKQISNENQNETKNYELHIIFK